MEKLQLTKKTELITSSSKITPPPPPRSHLSKDSLLKHLSLLKQFTVIVFTVILITACNVTEDNEAKTSSQAEITVTEISKRASTDIRDSYVIFRISANQSVTEYHLAVEESSKPAPTAAEMTSGALKRNLGTEPINVLIAQRLNAPMVGFAKKFFADNTYKTLGTGMTKKWKSPNESAIIHDDQASGSDAWVAQSVLKPETVYKLYGMEANGGSVTELLTFNPTDADASSASASAPDTLEYVDTTLEKENIEIAMHADEYYIFPLQVKFTSATAAALLNVFYSGKVSGDCSLDIKTWDFDIGSNDPGFNGQLLLVDQKSTEIETANTGTYVLVQTAVITSSPVRPNDIYFGQSYTRSDGTSTGYLEFFHLKIQE